MNGTFSPRPGETAWIVEEDGSFVQRGLCQMIRGQRRLVFSDMPQWQPMLSETTCYRTKRAAIAEAKLIRPCYPIYAYDRVPKVTQEQP